MWKLLTLALVLSAANCEILPFDNDAIEKVFSQKQPALFLFTDDEAASDVAKEALSDLDEEGLEGAILTISDKNDGFSLFDRLR